MQLAKTYSGETISYVGTLVKNLRPIWVLIIRWILIVEYYSLLSVIVSCLPPKLNVAWPISMIFTPALLNLMRRELQQPSATKKSPQEVTATDVGLQKRTALFPGTKALPRASSGVRSFFATGGNLNTWCSATSVNQMFSSLSIVTPCGR